MTTKKPKSEAMNSSFWHLDQESEASVLGSHFAHAVAAIATGHLEEFAPKPIPSRKTYFQEPRYNPNLQYAHITSGFDAHYIEEAKHWHRRSVPFDHQPRITQVAPRTAEDNGPRHAENYVHIFEQPVVSFGRNRMIRPQSRLKTAHTQPNPNIVQSIRMKNISHVTPLTYRLPDPWKAKSLSASLSHSHSSVFNSRTKRLDPLAASSLASKSNRQGSVEVENGSLLEASDSFLHVPNNLQSSLLSSPISPSIHLGVIDDHIRPRSSNMQSVRYDLPVRPVSPTIATITHSRLPGFTFSNIEKDQPLISSTGIDSEHLQERVFVREPAKDGSGYVIRPATLDEYMSKQQTLTNNIGQPEYHHIDPLPPVAMSDDTHLHPIPQYKQRKQYKAPRSKVIRYHDMFRNKRAEILHMDDSILDDDSQSQLSRGDDDLSQQDEHEEDADNKQTHEANSGQDKKKSYNKVLLSKWTPPMCYSKKSVGDRIIFNYPPDINSSSSAIVDANYPLFNSNEGKGTEDYIVHKSPVGTSRRLSSAGTGTKTFQEMDRHLRSQARQRMIPPPEVKLGKYQHHATKTSTGS